MRRLVLTSMLVMGGLLAVSCTGDRERLPTQGPSFSRTAPANHGRVEELIAKLFPPGDLRQQANDRLQAVQSALVEGDVATAQVLAIGPGGLVAFAVQQFAAGRLQPVNGVSPDPYLVDLINAIYEFVGLVGPIPESAKGPDGAIAVVGPGGGDVFTETRHAELNIPAGALNEDVLVTIARLPNAPVPLPTDLDQFPLFYDYATFPDVPKFNTKVTVALCVVDQGPFAPSPDIVPRLRLAHPRRPDRTTIEILPLASSDNYPNLSCQDVGDGTGSGSGSGLARGLTSAALWLFAPPPLHAATVLRPGGLGGSADNLSPFAAVDPGALVFTVQPTSVAAGALITPPVEVTVERANGSTITSFSGTITVALGVNPGEGTLSGTTTVTPVNGVATFADLSIDNVGTGYRLAASATSTLGEPPTPATSAPFDVIPNAVLINCAPTPGGDLLFRGFYVPQYPSTGLHEVDLYFAARAAGTYTIDLTARRDSFGGPVIGTARASVVLSADDRANVLTPFSFGPNRIASGSTVAFQMTQIEGPGSEVFFATSSCGLGDTNCETSCPVIETEDAVSSPGNPLDTFRRKGIGVQIIGPPPAEAPIK